MYMYMRLSANGLLTAVHEGGFRRTGKTHRSQPATRNCKTRCSELRREGPMVGHCAYLWCPE